MTSGGGCSRRRVGAKSSGLEERKKHYEQAFRRKLDGLNGELAMLKFLSQVLQVRAQNVREGLIKSTCADWRENFLPYKAKNRRNTRLLHDRIERSFAI